MMLYNLSIKNIKKSIEDYAIYFFTLVVAVAIFYVFNALESQTVLMNVSERTLNIVELMNTSLSAVSVFVSFILGLLIIYASRFLIKRRNKEFGIYMLLGMSKYQISKILFFETLIIGILSLIIGLLAGIALSQLMSIFVANLFEADMRRFTFVFSMSSALKTLFYFGIIYLTVMVFNTFIIGKCKLIDLINSMHHNEKIKLKNPYISILLFLLAIVILSWAYSTVTTGLATLTDKKLLLAIACGCIGTFLIFYSLSGLLLKISSKLKNFYYHNLNSFIFRQFDSQINTKVMSFSVISILLFVIICLIATCLTVRNSMNANIISLAPADFEYIMLDVSDESLNHNIKDYFNEINYDINKYSDDYIEFNIYIDEDLEFMDSVAIDFEEISKQYPFINYETDEQIIKISEYNELAKIMHRETFELKDDEYIVIADFGSMEAIRNMSLSKGQTINVGGKELKPKYDKCQDGIIELSSNPINSGVIIVADSIIDNLTKYSNVIVGNYNIDDKEDIRSLEEKIDNLISNNPYEGVIFSNTTLLEIKDSSSGLTAMITFIGLYLGLIFLISSALIIALIELSESSDNRDRYSILRKIGADEKMINRSLLKQNALFFGIPLAMAIIHSYFGMKFAVSIVEVLGIEKLNESLFITALLIIIIYGTYFLITYLSSKRIIKVQ